MKLRIWTGALIALLLSCLVSPIMAVELQEKGWHLRYVGEVEDVYELFDNNPNLESVWGYDEDLGVWEMTSRMHENHSFMKLEYLEDDEGYWFKTHGPVSLPEPEEQTEFDFEANEGWVLTGTMQELTLPADLPNLPAFDQTMDPSMGTVWTYINGDWKVYANGTYDETSVLNLFESTDTVPAGMGFWVNTGAIDEMTISRIQYPGNDDGDSRYVGETVTVTGVVTANFGNNLFIQDDGNHFSGIMIYKPSISPEVGDWVRATGEVKEYNNLTELVGIDGGETVEVEVLATGTVEPEITWITLNDDLEKFEGMLVGVRNVTISNPDLGHGEWEVTDGESTLAIDDLGVEYTGELGQSITAIIGVLNYSFNAYKIEPRSANDIIDVTITPISSIQQTENEDGSSTMNGQVVTTRGAVTAVDDQEGFFIQDGSGPWSAIMVTEPNVGVKVGDEVLVTGMVTEAQNDDQHLNNTLIVPMENTNTTIVTIIGEGEFIEPMEVPIEELGEEYESVLVRILDVSIENADTGFGEYLITDGTNSIEADDLMFTPSLTDGQEFRGIQGPLYYSYGEWKLVPRFAGDLIEAGVVTIAEIQSSMGELYGGQWELTFVADGECSLIDGEELHVVVEIDGGEVSGMLETADTEIEVSGSVNVDEGSVDLVFAGVDGTQHAAFTNPGSATGTWNLSNFGAGCQGAYMAELIHGDEGDGGSSYEGKTVTTQGVVTAVFGNNIFIQDGWGPFSGIQIYKSSAELEVGDWVVATGEVVEYKNRDEHEESLTELIGADGADKVEVTVISQGNPLPDYVNLPLQEMHNEKWEGVLVSSYGVIVSNADAGFSEWEIADPTDVFLVDNIGFEYAPTDGESLLYVRGPLNVSFDNMKIVPVESTDVGNPDAQSGTLATIAEIQGAAHISPLEGDIVETQGIVTAVGNNNFYIQSETPDDDDATSEGLLVYVGSTPVDTAGTEIAVGDLVKVIGTVTEYFPGGESSGNLSTTEITNPTMTLIQEDYGTITPLVIGEAGVLPPSEDIWSSDEAFDPGHEGQDFWESLEGMLVTVANPIVTGPTNGFGEVYVVAESGNGATGMTSRGGIRVSEGDFNPERIQVDDSMFDGTMPAFDVGQPLNDITGVISFNFNNFELLPTEAPTAASEHTLEAEVTTLAGDATNILIGNMNVENLDPSDVDDDGHNRFEQLADFIVNHMGSPDIIGLQEIQDNSGSEDDGVTSADATIQLLIDAVSNLSGPTYAYVEIAPNDNADGGQPGGNIRVGYLYNTASVTFTARGTATADTEAEVEVVGGVAQLVTNPARICTTGDVFDGGRKSLVAEFGFNGQTIIMVNNHLKSKGGDEPLYGTSQPPYLETEVKRNAQAALVNEFLDEVLVNDPDANVVVLGDLNDFEFSTPLSILKGGMLVELINTLPEEERYTYVYQGNSQVLDHILVSSNLAPNSQVDIVHVNSEYSEQVSDHDPVLAKITISATPSQPRLSKIGSYETGQYDESAAEIVDFDATRQRAFVVNSQSGKVDVLNLADPANPTKEFSLGLSGSQIGDYNSVSIHGDIMAAAIGNHTKTSNGFVAFYDLANLNKTSANHLGGLSNQTFDETWRITLSSDAACSAFLDTTLSFEIGADDIDADGGPVSGSAVTGIGTLPVSGTLDEAGNLMLNVSTFNNVATATLTTDGTGTGTWDLSAVVTGCSGSLTAVQTPNIPFDVVWEMTLTSDATCVAFTDTTLAFDLAVSDGAVSGTAVTTLGELGATGTLDNDGNLSLVVAGISNPGTMASDGSATGTWDLSSLVAGCSGSWSAAQSTYMPSELLEAGALPDMVTFTPDGNKVLVANEGEVPDAAYDEEDDAFDANGNPLNNPVGSVSIIDVSGGVSSLTLASVTNATFDEFADDLEVLIKAGFNFGKANSLMEDVEPEYIAVNADSTKAFVSLQENNAIAVVDLQSNSIAAILPLGFKDHSLAGNALDASNKDDGINITNWPIYGMYQPDSIAAFSMGDQTYVLTANEGDARDFEESRVKDITLDEDRFPDADELQLQENLGRINHTLNLGDEDGDGDFDNIYTYGGRSFSIWNEDGSLVFDSGDQFEVITAKLYAENFNSDNGENDSMDNRSDDKGPEPEAIAYGVINGRTYAFIGLERFGGVMLYDITVPTDAVFVDFLVTRDFMGVAEEGTAGDLGPEGFKFVPASKSPNGKSLLIAGHEVSGSTVIFVIE